LQQQPGSAGFEQAQTAAGMASIQIVAAALEICACLQIALVPND
jgi:hypothetical protein